MKLLMILISVTGMFELYRALNTHKNPINYVSYLFLIIFYVFIEDINMSLGITLMSLYIISCLVYFVVFHDKTSPMDLAVTVFGFSYVGFLLSGLYLTRVHPYGEYIVWLVFITAWGCDTFAYFTGRLLGKHKLAPVLSPKKTVEGAVGGVIGSVLLSVLYGFFISDFVIMHSGINVMLLCAIVSAVGSVFSQFGDLTASAIKRRVGIKDYGNVIPGHGGILDRFDSVLFSAPIVYAVVSFLM
jgi:phosphatidate cytidylyltransferase